MSIDVKTISDMSPFWDGLNSHEINLPYCGGCDRAHLPPSPFCPFCLSADIVWRAASGKGTLSTWVIERRKLVADFDPPYALGHVTLIEGPRLTAALSMSDEVHFRDGAPGRVEFYRAGNGRTLPMFRLDAAG